MPLPFTRALDIKLLKLVKENPILYNPSDPKYMDTDAKEVVWQKIGDTLNRHAPFCKTRWVNIRDMMRRRFRERLTSTRPHNYKYKYEDELSFMMPHFRDSPKNDENYPEYNQDEFPILEEFVNEPEYDNDDTKASVSSRSEETKEFNEPVIQEVNPLSVTPLHLNPLSTSDPIDVFLMTIGITLKKLNPYHLNQAKTNIFQVVQDFELKQIVSEQEGSASSN